MAILEAKTADGTKDVHFFAVIARPIVVIVVQFID